MATHDTQEEGTPDRPTKEPLTPQEPTSKWNPCPYMPSLALNETWGLDMTRGGRELEKIRKVILLSYLGLQTEIDKGCSLSETTEAVVGRADGPWVSQTWAWAWLYRLLAV